MERPLDRIFDQWTLDNSLVANLDQLWDLAQIHPISLTDPFEENWKWQCIAHWQFFYLDYERLRRLTNQPACLQAAMETEVEKVYDFYTLKRGEIERRIATCDPTNTHIKQKKRAGRRIGELYQLADEVQLILHYVKLNYRGFLDIILMTAEVSLSRILDAKSFYEPSVFQKFVADISRLHRNWPAITHSKQSYFSNVDTLVQGARKNSILDGSISSGSHRSSRISSDGGGDGERRMLRFESTFHSSDARPDVNFSRPPSLHSQKSLSSLSSSSSCMSWETAATSVPQDELIRTLKKFWIHPDNVAEILLYIARHTSVISNQHHVDVAVDEIKHVIKPDGFRFDFPQTPDGFALNSEPMLTPSFPHGILDTSASPQYTFCTTYLDTPDASVFTRRLGGRHTTGIRVRTYGQQSVLEEKEYFKQRGGYRSESTIHKTTTRHRVWLKSRKITPWLQRKWSLKQLLDKQKPYCQYLSNGEHTLTDADKITAGILQMEQDAHTHHLAPSLKVMQKRTMFGDQHTLSLSIDTDIAMIRPQIDVDGANYPYPSLSSCDIVRFPFAVLQVNMPVSSDTSEDRAWLDDLFASPLLESVDDFSVYLHGVSVLMPAKMQSCPSWLAKMKQMDLRRQEQVSHKHYLLPSKLRFAHRMSCSSSNSSNASFSKSSMSTRATTPTTPGREGDEAIPLFKNKFDLSDVSYKTFDHPESSISDSLGPTHNAELSTKMDKFSPEPGPCLPIYTLTSKQVDLESQQASHIPDRPPVLSRAMKLTLMSAFSSITIATLLYCMMLFL